MIIINQLSNLYIFITVYLLLNSINISYSQSYNNKPILKYNENNKFKIVQFTDLHYGEGIDKDLSNFKAQGIILDYEKPDYVVLSGDILSGWKYSNKLQYLKVWDLLTEPMIKRNIPWSIAFGNHDCEGVLSCLEIAELDMSYNLSLTQIETDISVAGLANYVLNIFPNDYIVNGNDSIDSNSSKSLIYIFDSETEGCKKRDHYGCIQKSQVEWYKDTSNKYNKKEGLAFVHIPPYEIIDVYNDQYITGEFAEKEICCYYTSESQFIKTMVEQGDIKFLSFGHDHLNDFYGNYNGVELGYGRKTGYGSYGPKHSNGARVFELSLDPQFQIKTWVRDVNGYKDLQSVSKSKYFNKLNVICCIPGDPRSKSWFYSMLSLLCVGFAFVVLVILIVMVIKSFKRKKIKT